ncbi:hypothetical protein [Pseudomonas sp. C9-3]|uniref:hypothetical protein n=1 Tax=Pseudomonas sp. C9-3 TaxID=3078264 RepID=UPI0028E5439C|nr:hypothetical protein [Pseudomonas sp. C9-3]
MTIRALSRLTALHSHLSPLGSTDDALLKANHFSTQLAELAAITNSLKALDDVSLALNNLGGAMELLLELLDAAHNRQLDGGHLHCLLQPLVSKLQQTLDVMDNIL